MDSANVDIKEVGQTVVAVYAGSPHILVLHTSDKEIISCFLSKE